jgi:6,7-dimethyl-8-ribityllumazine synthase
MATPQQLQLLPNGVAAKIKGSKIVVVKTAWNKHIIDELEFGVIAVCKANGVVIDKTVTVPGAVEIPFAIQAIDKSYREGAAQPQAYIALGCVIKGDTPHFEYVCQSVTQGITILNTQLDKPVIFGVLTVNNEQQALERLGGLHGHKGREAAETAISMMAMLHSLQDDIILPF